MQIKKTSHILLIFSLFLCFTQCGHRERDLSCFPQEFIDVSIDLNLPAYHSLNNVGQWIYLDKVGAGSRGLIVVRASQNTFKIYDRNAPHLCPDGEKTILKVVDDIKIICPKDGAEWILLTGQPTKVAGKAPKTYAYTFSPNTKILSIYN